MAAVTVRVFAEWFAFPLWIYSDAPGAEPDVESLGLTRGLIADFAAWNDEWMELAESDEDDEVWAATPEVVDWNVRGRALAGRLRAELGPAYDVVYFDYVTDENVRF